MFAIDLSSKWSIVLVQSHPTADLAARELADYLQRISGQPVNVAEADPLDGHNFRLQYREQNNDGFAWLMEDQNISLIGNSPRGLLFAVYDFLEELGCCWFAPGEQGENIPQGTMFTLPDQPVVESPAFPGRCLIIGHDAFMQDVRDWIVWAGRNRLNTIFFHTTTGSMALGAVPESRYQEQKPVFLPLMAERGMTLEHGGHGLAELLPRRLFSSIPGAFRFQNGARTPDHNFCPSSQEGLKVIRENAGRHFRNHPEVDIFHMWGDDIPGGGWCSCETCRQYSASEQLLLVINNIAEVLAEVNPAAQISLIAYHDTEAVPAQVAPHPNVHVLWAPRMRCYAHSLDNIACRVNASKYPETLRDHVEYFTVCGARPVRVFEYYLDAVLFKSVVPPLPTVIQQDAVFYRNVGVHTMQALMTGDYCWTVPQINVWLFPRLVWDPGQDLDTLITCFSRAAYGLDLLRYYRQLEKAFSIALDIVPEQLEITVVHGANSVWQTPPSDMGDPVFAPLGILNEKKNGNTLIQTCLDAAGKEMTAVIGTGNSRIFREREHFQLLKAWLEFCIQRVNLYAAAAAGSQDQIRACWREANASLKEVYRWGRRHIASPRHRLNFRYIQYFCWNIRLNKIRADHLCTGLGRLWVQVVTKLQLVSLRARLRHIFDARTMSPVKRWTPDCKEP